MTTYFPNYGPEQRAMVERCLARMRERFAGARDASDVGRVLARERHLETLNQPLPMSARRFARLQAEVADIQGKGPFLLVVDCGETGARATRFVRRFATLDELQEAKRQVDAVRCGHGCWRKSPALQADPGGRRLVLTKRMAERREIDQVREVDPDGRIVVHHRTVDTLRRMLKSANIDEAMYAVARDFQAAFTIANLDPIRATPIQWMPGSGREPELSERQLDARRRVHAGFPSDGGPVATGVAPNDGDWGDRNDHSGDQRADL